jgi:DNA replicative helicase MCM subunit Mcm2 (Cdc46/Mcm family)
MKRKKIEKLDKDFIFLCKKCGHNLYVERKKIHLVLKTDCPNCGEESYENWIFMGRGTLNAKEDENK